MARRAQHCGRDGDPLCRRTLWHGHEVPRGRRWTPRSWARAYSLRARGMDQPVCPGVEAFSVDPPGFLLLVLVALASVEFRACLRRRGSRYKQGNSALRNCLGDGMDILPVYRAE